MNELTTKQLLIAGGPVMLPIILCSITAMIIMINKWLYFKRIATNVNALKSEVFTLVRANKIKSAVIFCEKQSSPAADVLKAGLLKFGCRREEIKETVDYAISIEIPKLETGLIPLITIANVTPLFGVLGTVLGMTIIFQIIQNHSAGMHTITITDLSGGIWQALLTTLAGLAVAIPTFVGYNYFLNLVNKTVNELHGLGVELNDLLTRLNEATHNEIVDIIE